MEKDNIKIIYIPKGYIIDKEQSTDRYIRLVKEVNSYIEVLIEFFKENNCYFIKDDNTISEKKFSSDVIDIREINATSKRQIDKLISLNKLMNVAKYLNNTCESSTKNKYHIIDNNGLSITCQYTDSNLGVIYFKTKKLAEKAIKILGEEIIRLALCTDY